MASNRTLFKETDPLHALVEQGLAFVKLNTLDSSGPGDPVAVRGKQGTLRPLPFFVSRGARVRCDPR
jgi:hypothetical protein